MIRDTLFALETFKLALASIVMAYAAYSDIKTREIEPKLWLLGAVGGAITFYELYLIGSLSRPLFGLLTLELTFSLLLLPFFYVSYKLAMLGGADMLAYLFLSLTVPWYPLFLGFRSLTPVPIMTLLYATLLAVGFALVRLIKNLMDPRFREFVRSKGVGGLSLIHYAMSGKVIEAKEYLNSKFWYLMHEIKDGEVKKELRRRVSIDEEPEDHKRALRESIQKGLVGEGEYLMVTYATPFLVYMALGFALALIFGDHWVRQLFS